MDTFFLSGETPNAPLHVLAALILEPRRARPGVEFDRLRERIRSRLPALPLLRRRLLEVPLGLDHPVWVDDADFDLDAHLHREALPAPGGERELREWVGRLAEAPLCRARPLWEIRVAEGLAGNRLALAAKIHHALVDGVGGAALLAALLGAKAEPDADEAPDGIPEVPFDGGPSSLGLLADAATGLALRPLRAGLQLWRSSGASGRLALAAVNRTLLPGAAPRTALNGPVSSRRVVATGSVSLDDVKRVKHAFPCTVNHVVLAACAAALRRYLAGRGRIPGEPLVAAVPMALGERAGDGAGNSLSVVRIPIPVHLARALDRLDSVRDASRLALRNHEPMRSQLGEWADLASPALIAPAAQLYHRLGLAAHHAPLHNVVISNVPGPPEALFCGGSRITACHPFGPIYDGWGLNLTVMSYAGRLGIGAIGCPRRVPNIEAIPRAFEAAVAQLVRLADRQERGEGSHVAA